MGGAWVERGVGQADVASCDLRVGRSGEDVLEKAVAELYCGKRMRARGREGEGEGRLFRLRTETML